MESKVAAGSAALIRQGDVLLVPVGELPEGSELVSQEGGRVVLARGEATGHAHVLEDERAGFYEHVQLRRWAASLRTRFLVVEGGASTLSHEEHDPLSVPPGVYEVRRQREYRPGRVVRVSD
jgi:hypothetical protein